MIYLTNMVTNGNFASTSNWSHNGASFSASGNEGTFTANGAGDFVYQTLNIANAHKYYICDWINSSSSSVRLGISDLVTNDAYASHSGSSSYEFLSFVFTSIRDKTGAYLLAVQDNRAGSWNSVNMKYLSMIDLTASFGAGNEPTKTQMDALMTQFANNWLDGTKTAIYNW